jgi:hypothetical protein
MTGNNAHPRDVRQWKEHLKLRPESLSRDFDCDGLLGESLEGILSEIRVDVTTGAPVGRGDSPM